jgi:hypothetical protein
VPTSPAVETCRRAIDLFGFSNAARTILKMLEMPAKGGILGGLPIPANSRGLIMDRSWGAIVVLLLTLTVLNSSGEIARGQDAYTRAAQAAHEADMAARVAEGAAKKAKKEQMREWRSIMVPLSKEDLAKWKRIKSPSLGVCWKYEVNRNKANVAVVHYSPQLGYFVNGKANRNGFGWPSLDAALQANFNGKDIWRLPDIPGWTKSHDLTPDEHLAEVERSALEQGKGKAAEELGYGVGKDIVNKRGPKITGKINKKLGLDEPEPAKE